MSKYTLEVKKKSLNLLVYEFEVLLDLVNFELVVAVSDGSIGILVVVVAAGVDGVVEELVPVKVLVVFFQKLLERNSSLLGDSQFYANDLGQVCCRYFLSRQEVPDKGYLVNYDLNIVIAYKTCFLTIQIAKT